MYVSIRQLFKGYYKYCQCGCKYLIPIVKKNGEFTRFKHGHQNRGQNHGKWKNGRKKVGNYWYIWVPDEYNMNLGEYIREHVYFYEQYHKCCILPWTDIHHIESVTSDYCNNMPWNLQAMMKSEHTRMNMIGNEYNKDRFKDMNDNRCSLCGSDETYIKKNGRPYWCYIDKRLVCSYCYGKWYDKNKRIR